MCECQALEAAAASLFVSMSASVLQEKDSQCFDEHTGKDLQH